MGHGWVPLRLSCWWLAVVFAVSHFSGNASANGFISGPERRCPINEVAACHRPLHVRLLGARFHPDGTRSMRQPAGSAVRAGQSSRPTVRSRRAKKRPSRRTTSQRERRSPASRRGSSTSPGRCSHVLPPAHQCRRGLPRPNRRAAEGSARRGAWKTKGCNGCPSTAGFLPTVCDANTARRQRCRTRENHLNAQDPMGLYYPNIVEISDISSPGGWFHAA